MSEKQSAEIERFKAVLQAYGSRETSWPASEVSALNATLAQSSLAHQLWEEAKMLDFALADASSPLAAPSSLVGAVMQDAADVLQGNQMRFSPLRWIFLKPASGLVLAACLGIFLGFVSPDFILYGDDINLDELSVSDTVLEWELNNDNS